MMNKPSDFSNWETWKVYITLFDELSYEETDRTHFLSSVRRTGMNEKIRSEMINLTVQYLKLSAQNNIQSQSLGLAYTLALSALERCNFAEIASKIVDDFITEFPEIVRM